MAAKMNKKKGGSKRSKGSDSPAITSPHPKKEEKEEDMPEPVADENAVMEDTDSAIAPDVAASEDDIGMDLDDDDDDDDDGEGGEKSSAADGSDPSLPIPFLDTFYALSSDASPRERSVAARCLLGHVFPEGEGEGMVRPGDARYALRRLMDGLCSGRAGARQGYASCLASFLRLAEERDALGALEIDGAEEKAGASTVEEKRHSAEYIRSELIRRTSAASASAEDDYGGGGGGKRRGSEERDLRFGRLFGVLAVAKSGTLTGEGVPIAVVRGYVSDLIQLYQYKIWMRESAAFAVTELLSMLLKCPSPSARIAALDVIKEKIVPQMLLKDAGGKPLSDETDLDTLLPVWTAEQAGLCVRIQTLHRAMGGDADPLPYPLDRPVLTAGGVSLLAEALGKTSAVVYPRSHFVWSAVWLYLSNDDGTLRSSPLPNSDEGEGAATVRAVVESVISRQLLRMGDAGEADGGEGEDGGGGVPGGAAAITHERRALALALVQALCVKLLIPADLLQESVLCPAVVSRLFVRTLSTSPGGGGGKRGDHTLKPLASRILKSIADDAMERGDLESRLAYVRSFVSAEPRFDAMTKTGTISRLLHGDDNGKGEEDKTATEGESEKKWDRYISFLEECVLSSEREHNATAYVDLLFALGRHVIRTGAQTVEGGCRRRILGFLMAGAFFDCSEVVAVAKKSEKKKGKKKRRKGDKVNEEESQSPSDGISVAAGMMIRKSASAGRLPKRVRDTVSSRFFSLLSDTCSAALLERRGGGNEVEGGHVGGPDVALKVLQSIAGIRDELEAHGAQPLVEGMVEPDADRANNAEEAEVEVDVSAVYKELLTLSDTHSDSEVEDAEGKTKSRVAASMAMLLTALRLRTLSTGSDEGVMEEDGENNEDDMQDDVMEMMIDLAEVAGDLLGVNAAAKENRDNDGDTDENDGGPFVALSEFCINVLSSPICGDAGAKVGGGSTKLIRDCVKSVCSSGMAFMSICPLTQANFKGVTSVMLEAVCGSEHMDDEVGDAHGNNDDSDSDEGNSDEDGDDMGVFTSAANAADLDLSDDEKSSGDGDNSDDDGENITNQSDNDEEELDPSRLENLLLDDSDDELTEHHAGADGALVQLIKMKQETRKSVRMAKEKAYLSGRLRCAVLLEIALSAPLDCEVILMTLLPMLRSIRSLERSISGAVSNETAEGRGSATVSEKRALRDRLEFFLKTKVCRTQKYDAGKESKGEAIDLHEKYIAEEILEEARKGVEKEHSSRCSLALITVLRMLVHKGDSACVEVSKEIYTIAVKEWSAKKAKRLDVSLFDDLLNKLPRLARIVLPMPLSIAAKDGKSLFLKSESLRLLSSLYKLPKLDAVSSTMDSDAEQGKLGQRALGDAAVAVTEAIGAALKDADLKKSKKRVRDILKAAESLVLFASSTVLVDEALGDVLCELSIILQSTESDSHTQAVKSLCKKLTKDINLIVESSKEAKLRIESEKKSIKVETVEKKKKKKRKK